VFFLEKKLFPKRNWALTRTPFFCLLRFTRCLDPTVSRLLDHQEQVLRAADQHGWDAAEIFENLSITSVMEGERLDAPALIQTAIRDAAALKVRAKADKTVAVAAEKPPSGGKGGGKGGGGGRGRGGAAWGNYGGGPYANAGYGRVDDYYGRGYDRGGGGGDYERRRSRSPPSRYGRDYRR